LDDGWKPDFGTGFSGRVKTGFNGVFLKNTFESHKTPSFAKPESGRRSFHFGDAAPCRTKISYIVIIKYHKMYDKNTGVL